MLPIGKRINNATLRKTIINLTVSALSSGKLEHAWKHVIFAFSSNVNLLIHYECTRSSGG